MERKSRFDGLENPNVLTMIYKLCGNADASLSMLQKLAFTVHPTIIFYTLMWLDRLGCWNKRSYYLFQCVGYAGMTPENLEAMAKLITQDEMVSVKSYEDMQKLLSDKGF